MRPNLMSPRRASGEDSILAMLERDPARRHPGAGSAARLAWYGASGAVALALIGTLVWLASNNDGLRPEIQRSVLAEAARNAPAHGPAHATGGAPSAPRSGAAPLRLAMATPPAAAAPSTGSAAVIVDQPASSDKVPPLRLLKPAPANPAPAPSVRVAVPAAKGEPRPVERAALPAPRSAAVAADTRAATRPAAVPARPRPAAVSAARNAARPAPGKTQRAAPSGKTGETQVDPDVALISAVIVHANGHAPEGAQMTELLCPNDSCKASPPRQ